MWDFLLVASSDRCSIVALGLRKQRTHLSLQTDRNRQTDIAIIQSPHCVMLKNDFWSIATGQPCVTRSDRLSALAKHLSKLVFLHNEMLWW